MNDIQVVGTHNSYKQRMDPDERAWLLAQNPELARQLDYGHVPLPAQLDLGVRVLELDVRVDPANGLYDPADGTRLPGFQVRHGTDVDTRSSCASLRECLAQLRAWSIAHPNHVPIVITIEPKDALRDARAWEALDREVLLGLGRERLIVPDDVRGHLGTLEEAVLDERWPLIDDVRGMFLVALDIDAAAVASYCAGHPGLRDRALFVNAPEGRPEAAFRIINNPIEQRAYIEELVRRGYLVRTRADADAVEARSGDTRRREAAFESGAQLISTDYVVPDPAFHTGYRVRLPQGGAARCNPLRSSPCVIAE